MVNCTSYYIEQQLPMQPIHVPNGSRSPTFRWGAVTITVQPHDSRHRYNKLLLITKLIRSLVVRALLQPKMNPTKPHPMLYRLWWSSMPADVAKILSPRMKKQGRTPEACPPMVRIAHCCYHSFVVSLSVTELLSLIILFVLYLSAKMLSNNCSKYLPR